jgi:hypothetical protein
MTTRREALTSTERLVKAELRAADFTDHRTKWQLESARAIEQERADVALEKRWRENIRQNIQRRIAAKVNHGC